MNNIAIGQYVPARSVIHRMDSRVKLILMTVCIILTFAAQSFSGLGIVVLFTFTAMLCSKIRISSYLKSIKAIIVIVAVTAVLNLFYGSGEPLVQWGFVTITANGINNALFIALRIILLVLISAVLTFTTSPTDLTDGLERVFSPLKIFHLKVHEIAMMMSIALRFIPTLFEETQKIMSAQKARGADMESGGLARRVKAFVPILIPLFISAFRRAGELASAMECRCYNGGQGRTRMKIMHIKKPDVLAIVISVSAFIGVILCNIFLPVTIK